MTQADQWTWRYETTAGEPIAADDGGQAAFPTQADAESWIGESWRGLLEQGVEQVVLLEDDREVYGPMSLRPA
jgi:hypothetical protein